MEALVIDGGRPLVGTVDIGGAKNAALPILAAAVIHGGVYRLDNCPQITDVALASQIIEALGGQVHRTGSLLQVDTTGVCRWEIPDVLMSKMRASVLFLGALLARFGRASLTMPGGCPLGRRPIDLHLQAVAQMGAEVTMQEQGIVCEAPTLHGCCIDLPFPSVGATENVLLAATACRGTVTLRGAAKEPEIGDLIRFLQAMGAEITGQDTDVLTICGSSQLRAADHRILPDRMETATYLCMAAGCGGSVTLRQTDGRLLLPVLQVLEKAGCAVSVSEDEVMLAAPRQLRGVGEIETLPYPGFPTDAQAPVMAALLRAAGNTRFSEGVFCGRFGHVSQLRKFGADITRSGSSAQVRGVARLHGAQVEGCDLRATAALVAAALQAVGKSTVFGLNHLDRGYDNLEEKLRSLGAAIERREICPVQ